ncbi:MAG TPA: zinc-binding dehydrogenase [Syntrophorhabdaceae bacterium]|nr:zinc-binding dehydrogenase [Syntrophorhabdaceae bacterium]HQM80231.1 zinc-binding dehydrogenase [Syntrophorhabdaceae bacterium]
MKAVVFLGERKVELRNFPDPVPGPGEVVLKIKASGICGSDLGLYRAPKESANPNLIVGHEPCGVVAEVGETVPPALAKVGMRVMVHHYKGCGVCNHCRSGWAQLCRNGMEVYGRTDHGSHAEYMRVPASTLIPLPEELPFEVGAAISCGTGTAWGALVRLGLSGRETITIFGQGPVGLSATQFAKAMGAYVIALDVNDERLALAREMGADKIINTKKEDPIKGIEELTHGEGAELALDCSGSPDARIAAVRSTRTWGKVCLVGEGNTLTLDVSPDLLRRQITIIGSWTFSTIGQAECTRFIVDRKIPVERVFSHRYYSLDDAGEAYRVFDAQATGKGVFLL